MALVQSPPDRSRDSLKEKVRSALQLTYRRNYSAPESRLDDLYIDGRLCMIHGIYKAGSKRQIAIRMNQETDEVAVCHLVAASRFAEAFKAYDRRSDRRVFVKASERRQGIPFSCMTISFQRQHSTGCNYLPAILISETGTDQDQIPYYPRSELAQHWNELIKLDERIITLLRNMFQPTVPTTSARLLGLNEGTKGASILEGVVIPRSEQWKKTFAGLSQPSTSTELARSSESGSNSKPKIMGTEAEVATAGTGESYVSTKSQIVNPATAKSGRFSTDIQSECVGSAILSKPATVSSKDGMPAYVFPREIKDMILMYLFNLPVPFCPIKKQKEQKTDNIPLNDEPWLYTQEQYRCIAVVDSDWHEAIVQYFRRCRIQDELILACALSDEKRVEELLGDPQVDVNRKLRGAKGYKSELKHDAYRKKHPGDEVNLYWPQWKGEEVDVYKDDLIVLEEFNDDQYWLRAREGQTALMTAAATGHHGIVQRLYNHRTINRHQLDYAGCNVFTYARYGSMAVCRFLAEHNGANRDTVVHDCRLFHHGWYPQEVPKDVMLQASRRGIKFWGYLVGYPAPSWRDYAQDYAGTGCMCLTGYWCGCPNYSAKVAEHVRMGRRLFQYHE